MAIKSDNANKVGKHTFETSGCGKAPFKFVGFFEDRGPKNVGGMQVGSPGQPMGTCKHCGAGIALCCTIRDANGKEFVVGSTCVEKTGDSGIIQAFKKSPEKREHDRAVRHAREALKVAELEALVKSEADALEAIPHSRGFIDRETEKPMTMLDEVNWMLNCCGNSGKIRTLKWIKKTLAGN